MDKPDILYDGRTREEWMTELAIQQEWNARHAMAMFACLGLPQILLDVGCGDGTMVGVARGFGCISFGVDQLVTLDTAYIGDRQYFFRHNLVDKFTAPHTANMVICLEVAEHIHPSAHPTLCDTLCDNLKEGRGNFLVFSSAHPGQGGSIHVAERPAQYWQNEFHLRHLNFRLDLTTRLQLAWSNLGSPLWWLPANVMVFEK